jgi:hypothetical protein
VAVTFFYSITGRKKRHGQQHDFWPCLELHSHVLRLLDVVNIWYSSLEGGSRPPFFYRHSSCRNEFRQMAVPTPFPEMSHRQRKKDARREYHFLHFTPRYLRTILETHKLTQTLRNKFKFIDTQTLLAKFIDTQKLLAKFIDAQTLLAK